MGIVICINIVKEAIMINNGLFETTFVFIFIMNLVININIDLN